MESKQVMVKVSPKQMSRLRNGHKVRVRPAMEGEGVCLVVHPENYSILTRTFGKNRGAEIMLSPDEIASNKQSMIGNGIFGKKFDRAVKKAVGKKGQKELYAMADNFLPFAQGALTAGLATGASALGAVQPQLIPFLPAGVAGLSALGSDYLAHPSKYQKRASSLAKEYAKNLALQKLNDKLGTNMGELSSAALGKAASDKASAELTKLGIEARKQLPIVEEPGRYKGEVGLFGGGLYAGMRRSGGAVGVRGNLISHGNMLPPAMRSQADSANYQFQYTLPPGYQKGSGLYI